MKSRLRPRYIRNVKSKMGVPVTLYDTALNQAAYGDTAMIGDLFNDIMSSVVPSWNERPDWMKKIQVKPDPIKIAEAAAKVVPPKLIGKGLNTASQYGVNMFYSTPAGSVPITGGMIQGGYANLPGLLQAKDFITNIPSWVYMAGGIGLFVLIFSQGHRR